MIKVLGRITSINVRKVLWTLDELGMPYEREDWGLPERSPQVPEFLALNPNAQVPVIVDAGFVLWESNVVMRYLAEKEGSGTVLPHDPRERAIVEQWLQWQATELNPTWGYAVYALLRKAPGYDDAAEVQRSLAKWGDKMRLLETRLAETGAYAGGGSFSLADIALGLSLRRWYALPAELPEFPAARRYYERLRERPAGAPYLAEAYF